MAVAGLFDWQEVVSALGATAIVVAALAWLAKLAIGEYFKKLMAVDLAASTAAIADQYKTRQGELERAQQASLATLQAALGRAERLETDLARSRGDSYGAIWALTGAVNLFGPGHAIDQAELSASLKDWYFQHGWLLSRDAKEHYFLVQEALNFALTRGIAFTRPDGEILFAGDERPVEILKRIRHEALAIPAKPPDEDYSPRDVEAAVVRWKRQPGPADGFTGEERAWMLFQFALSSLRTRLAAELGSRRPLGTAP